MSSCAYITLISRINVHLVFLGYMQLQKVANIYVCPVCVACAMRSHTTTSPPPCAAYQSEPPFAYIHFCDDFVLGDICTGCTYCWYYLKKLFNQKKALNIFVRVHFKHSLVNMNINIFLCFSIDSFFGIFTIHFRQHHFFLILIWLNLFLV